MQFKCDGVTITLKGSKAKVDAAQAAVVASYSRGEPAVIDGAGLQLVFTQTTTAEERRMATLLDLPKGTPLDDCATVLKAKLDELAATQAERDQFKANWDAAEVRAATPKLSR